MLIGVALFGAGLQLVVGRRWYGLGSAAWFSALIVAHAAALRWVEAGPVVGYPHTRLELLFSDPVAMGVLFLEVAAVTIGLARYRSRIEGGARRIGLRRLAAAAVILLAIAASPSADPGVYAGESLIAFGVQLLHLCLLGLGLLALPPAALDRLRAGAARWFRPADAAAAPRIDRFVLVTALVAGLVAAGLSLLVYERHPHLPDEVSYLLHARYLATGVLEMTPPPVPEAFRLDLMTIEPTRWYSPVPAGWPAVLAVGAAVGLPWLVNPVLVLVCVLLAYLLAWHLFGRPVARISALLLAGSPWLLFLGMSFMSHVSSLALAVGAGVATARWSRTRRVAWLLVAGGGVGALGLTRPLEAVTVGICLAVAIFLVAHRWRWKPLAALVVGSLAVGSLVFPYNAHFTGSPFEFPINGYLDERYGEGSNALGFGPDRGLGWANLDPFPGHDVRDAAINTVVNAAALDDETFGWPTGSLIAALALFLFRGASRRDVWVAAIALLLLGLHALYWFSGGPDFGARYWFLALFPIVVLSARAIGDPVRDVRPAIAAFVLCMSAAFAFIPWRASDKYYEYRGMTPEVGELARTEGFGRALVLIRGRIHPDYASAAVFNPVDLERSDGPVFVREYGPRARATLEAAFPDRPVFVVAGPTVTGRGYEVVDRPRGR